MSVSTRKVLVPSLAASLSLILPQAVRGQGVSSRPASVALTVVVPERAPDTLAIVDAVVLRRTDSMLDVETIVGIANRQASRVEVRLGTGWSENTRVLVQNRAGDYQALAANVPVVAGVASATSIDAPSRLRFRVQSEAAIGTRVSVPVEYRVTVGAGDQIAVWTIPAVLELGNKP